MNENIHSLRRKRSGVLDKRSALVKIAVDAGRGLTTEEIATDDAFKLEADSLAKTITRAEELERELAVTARPLGENGNEPLPAHRIEVSEVKRPKGRTFIACVLAIAGADFKTKKEGRPYTPEQFAREVLRDEFVAAGLNANTLAAGGGLIREDISADFIELLRAKTVVRRAGANEVPMPNGNLTLNGQSGGATATWVGEQAGVKASAQLLRQVKLSAKKLRCTVPISNDLLRFAGESVMAMASRDIEAVVSTAEDLAFLRGAGTAFTPKGLKNQGGGSHAANATVTVASVTSETGQSILNLLNANSRMINPCWFWAPRTTIALRNQRNSNGFKVWPEIEEQGQFRGFPFFDTTAIPTNLISIDSEIYFQDMADLVIGQAPAIAARVSSEASYQDASGTLVSAFDRDETVIDIIEELDFAVRHTGSVDILTAVEYVP